MKLLQGFGLVICLSISTSASAGLKSTVFSGSDSEAIIIIEERDDMRHGMVFFDEIDLENMIRGKKSFEIQKDLVHGLSTTNPRLKASGEIAMFKMTRFSGRKVPAGDFALVSYKGGMLGGQSCLPDGVPVYRLKQGVANLISADKLPRGGGSFNIWDKKRASDVNEDVIDVQELLSEYPNVKTEVVEAEIVAVVKFQKKNGQSSGCFGSKDVIKVPQDNFDVVTDHPQ
jgi:hypothetical protein